MTVEIFVDKPANFEIECEVAGCLISCHGSCLMLQYHSGKWTAPGGRVEAGESAIDGACREVLEETGIELDPSTLQTINRYYIRTEEHSYAFTFYYTQIDQEIEVQLAADEHKDHQWVSWYDLLDLDLLEQARGLLEICGPVEDQRLGSYGVCVKDQKILLVKKVKGIYKGLLDLPGGGVEFGESGEQALERELVEEVTLVSENLSLLENLSVQLEGVRKGRVVLFHHIGLLYLASGLEPCAGEPEEEYVWLPLSGLSMDQLTPFAGYAVQAASVWSLES